MPGYLFHFLENIERFSTTVVPFYVPIRSAWEFHFSTPLPRFGMDSLLDFQHSSSFSPLSTPIPLEEQITSKEMVLYRKAEEEGEEDKETKSATAHGINTA